MKNLLLGSLAGTIALVAMLPVFADQIQTTTETVQSPPQVIDSYMKPTVTQTKTVTEGDGTTHTSTAPMIMERHEQVVLPTSEVTTTTTSSDPKVITEETSKTVSTVASPRKKVVRHSVASRHKKTRHVVAHKARRHVVAYRRPAAPSAIAETIRKTTVVEPQVIQQTQTIQQKGVIIDRKDPALDQF